jgi:hypothetical protein
MSGSVVNICLITKVWFNEKNCVACRLSDVCYMSKVFFVLFHPILKLGVTSKSENHKRFNGGELSVH